MKMIKRLLFLFLLGTTSFIGYAQDRANEFNAQVKINSDKIQGTNKQVYTTLQDALTQFINTRKWTDATFGDRKSTRLNPSHAHLPRRPPCARKKKSTPNSPHPNPAA